MGPVRRDHDDDLDRRDVRRTAGLGPSALRTVDWLDDIHRLFPKVTIERLERDAVERYEILEVVTDPAGAPSFALHGAAEARAKEIGITATHLSISHDTTVATAFVVAEC